MLVSLRSKKCNPNQSPLTALTLCTRHWDEWCLDNELMTGKLNSGETNPLSRVTVASFQDIGYDVNITAADMFSPRCRCPHQTQVLANSDQAQFPPSSNTSSPYVKLRDDLWLDAMKIGQDILYNSRRSNFGARAAKKRSSVSYVGDVMLSVIVEQDGEYFGVKVVDNEVMESYFHL